MRAGAVLAVLVSSGCSEPGDEEIRRHAENGAEQVRPLAGALADEFDQAPERVADEILKCSGRGPDDPAMELNLLLRVTFDDADQTHLEEVVVPDYEADGWRHRTNDWGDHFFIRDRIVLGVARDADRATISGSAGCWPD